MSNQITTPPQHPRWPLPAEGVKFFAWTADPTVQDSNKFAIYAFTVRSVKSVHGMPVDIGLTSDEYPDPIDVAVGLYWWTQHARPTRGGAIAALLAFLSESRDQINQLIQNQQKALLVLEGQFHAALQLKDSLP